ncbi:hypothetical protein DFS33DRAFT_1267068, partial [Desarmillaria ectypa]
KPDDVETIKAVRFPPHWQTKVQVKIPESMQEATTMERIDRSEVQAYGDGSDIENGIGAAAVVYRRGRKVKTVRMKVGEASKHKVYDGEGISLILCTEAIRGMTNVQSASISIDNTSAIQATKLIRPAPSHHIFDTLHQRMDMLLRRHSGIEIKIRWVSGHQGIVGKEAADEEAKAAARGDVSEQRYIPAPLRKPIPINKTSLLLEKLATSLPRKITSIMMQLRTGHIRLNRHLFNIRRIDSPACPNYSYLNESTHHFLIHCPAYRAEREIMRQPWASEEEL